MCYTTDMERQVKATLINIKPMANMSVFGTFFAMAQAAGASRRAYISAGAIASQIGLSKRSVYSGQRRLAQLGWIRRAQGGGWEIALVDDHGNPTWGGK